MTSALATAALARPVGHWLSARGSLDIPNHRSSHTAPVPRGGGLAAIVGAAAAVALSGTGPSFTNCASIATLAAVGWTDDLTGHIPARTRLAAQVTVGGLAPPQGGWDHALGTIIVPGVVNVVNFMDGINGISAMTGIIWGINAMSLPDRGEDDLAQLGALTVGTCLGFLPYNIPSARLFLGDVGSYALGATFAIGILSQSSPRSRYKVAAPLLLYGLDASQALVNRLAKGHEVGIPHRDHIYQRLVDIGLSHVTVAMLHATGAALLSVAARLPSRRGVPITLITVGSYLALPTLVRLKRTTRRRSI